MMNCFETRQEFVSFWRGALDRERRRVLLAHLQGCSKCDRAFRTFALTAPMLHPKGEAVAASGDAAPQAVSRGMPQDLPQDLPIGMSMSGARRADATRAAEILRRASVCRLEPRRRVRQWRELAAGVSAVAAAALVAYFSVAAPPQSFDEVVTSSDSISETVPLPGTDFLGQRIPSIPAVSSDLAG